MGFVSDPWICLPIAVAVIAGGLGFPVWLELYRRFRPTWARSMHTRMTLAATAALLVLGTVFVTASRGRTTSPTSSPAWCSRPCGWWW